MSRRGNGYSSVATGCLQTLSGAWSTQIRLLIAAVVRAGVEILNPNMKQALFAGVTVKCGQIQTGAVRRGEAAAMLVSVFATRR